MDMEKRVKEIYEVDFSRLVDELKAMGKEERMRLYEVHSKRLFPKSRKAITLEEQLNDNRKVDMAKFKMCFRVVCGEFFSTEHFGEYCKRRFMKKTGLNTQIFPQKVILALSLMGYIKEQGLKCNYSTGNHGYIYQVDYLKVNRFDQDLFAEPPAAEEDFDDEPAREYSDLEKAWLVEKQLNTIRAISVDKGVFKSLMQIKDEYLSNPETKTWHEKELHHINSMERLYYRRKSNLHITIDGAEGRLYSVMTRLNSNMRRNGSIHIQGEGFREVDLSSLHPTLFGLHIRTLYPGIESQWVNHCLSGDFYEWVIDITGMEQYSVEEVIRELGRVVSIGWRKKHESESLKEKACKMEKVIQQIEDEASEDKHKKFRPVVKCWIMGLLFSKFRLSSTEKDGNSIYKHFCHNLCMYLKEHEPRIYEQMDWYKNNPIPKRRDPTKHTSKLPLVLQREEVRFIKQCLKNLDSEVRYLYTIHDCIGCLASDAEKVKRIMEQTSIEMYGVKLNLKIEGGERNDLGLLRRAS